MRRRETGGKGGGNKRKRENIKVKKTSESRIYLAWDVKVKRLSLSEL